MCRKILVLLMLVFCVYEATATHIAGGELYYEYLGPSSSGLDRYKITMRLFRSCDSRGQELESEVVNVGIYNSNDLSRVDIVNLRKDFVAPQVIQNTQGLNPCLTGNPVVCYQIGTFSDTILLPKTAAGYTLAWLRLTRVSLDNVLGNNLGATFVTKIPGTNQLPEGNNSSPKFKIKDTTIICKQSLFKLDFSADDPDGDSIAYKFAPAYNTSVGSETDPIPTPPSFLVLPSLNYRSPYFGTSPLGSKATIDSLTGLISGTAPSPGAYVVCVTAEEWRNGILINTHRKDFILNVKDCNIDAVQLDPKVTNCSTFTLSFFNQSSSSEIEKYFWSFGDGSTSEEPTPKHTYADTGIYIAQLKVKAKGGCLDSARTIVAMYPGFEAKMFVKSGCINNPFTFSDSSYVKYGKATSWKWEFGEPSTTLDSSSKPSASYKYPTIGSKTVVLWVKSDRGCVDTDTLVLNVLDKPKITLPFRDTLICSIDSLPITIQADGKVSWTPNYQISDTSSLNPIVFPLKSTVYRVLVDNNGCLNNDSLTVNVLPFIKVDAGLDTAICATDTIQLAPTSSALSYQWVASSGETVAKTKFPRVRPLVNTVYYVTANLGKCQDKDSVNVLVNPYPQIAIGADTAICFGKNYQFNAIMPVGDSIQWQPAKYLTNRSILNPISKPDTTIQYIASAFNKTGCLKPKSDTMLLTVLPFYAVDAGKDTIICFSDSVQLSPISLSPTYQWQLANGQLVANSKQPFVRPLANTKYFVTANMGKCQDVDSINVVVIPYPQVRISSDTTLCFGQSMRLLSSIVADTFYWRPKTYLLNAASANPFVNRPDSSIAYTLTVQNKAGCTKPNTDTIRITVVPKVVVNAGNDTSVVVNQELQLSVTANTDSLQSTYAWTVLGSSVTYLNNSNIKDPIGLYNGSSPEKITYQVRVTQQNGCFGEDAVNVQIFKIPPDFLVPSGFTPGNGDNLNDVLRPVAVGISKLELFSVYNRYGQLLFTTNEFGKGWNGQFNGQPQPAGTYVYFAKGLDYQRRPIQKKGTAVLIR